MKRLLSIFLVIILLFTVCACGEVTPQQSGETRQITDCLGRTVDIPADPQRIVCLYASTAHLVAMMDEGDKIVGAPNGVKRDILMQKKYPDIVNVASPYEEGSINVEELARIDADLALVRYSTGQNQAEVEKLNNLGIPYVVVDFYTLDELKTAISVIGDVFNNPEKANEFKKFFDDTIGLVTDRLQDVKEDEKPIVYHSVNEATRTDVENTICSEITDLAGIRNASVENGMQSQGDKAYTTLEEIYRWDPDAIIANEYSVTDYILSDDKWAGLQAVINQKVYTLPIGATRWCHPASIEAHMAVLAIANMFYPDKFSDLDIEEYIKNYYSKFFGLELDDEEIDMILSGKGMRIQKDGKTDKNNI